MKKIWWLLIFTVGITNAHNCEKLTGTQREDCYIKENIAAAEGKRKPKPITEIDCSAVLGEEAQKRCYAKQDTAFRTIVDPTYSKPKKNNYPNGMTTADAVAIIEYSSNFLKDCRIKVDVYWPDDPVKSSCIFEALTIAAPDSDLMKAGQKITEILSIPSQKEISPYKVDSLTNDIKQMAEDVSYISLKVKK